MCNSFIKKWAKKKFKKNNIQLHYDYEGYYERIFIKALCHYVGYLVTPQGIELKIKGIEAKRRNVSKFIKEFQTTLINKVLECKTVNGKTQWTQSKEDILSWILNEMKRIKTLPLIQVGFPCKLARRIQDYNKSTPIFVRAIQNTQEILSDFDKGIGNLFYFVYVNPIGDTQRKTIIRYKDYDPLILDEDLSKKEAIIYFLNLAKQNDILEAKNLKQSNISVTHKRLKPKDVLAFDENNQDHIKNINWSLMIDRSIMSKVKTVFDIMNWEYGELLKEV